MTEVAEPNSFRNAIDTMQQPALFEAWRGMIGELAKHYKVVEASLPLPEEQRVALHLALEDSVKFAKNSDHFAHPEKIVAAFTTAEQPDGAVNAINYFKGTTASLRKAAEAGRMVDIFTNLASSPAFEAQGWLDGLTLHGDDHGFRQALKPTNALSPEEAKAVMANVLQRAGAAFGQIFTHMPAEVLEGLKSEVEPQALPALFQQATAGFIAKYEQQGRLDEITPEQVQVAEHAAASWEAMAKQSPEQQQAWLEALGLCMAPDAARLMSCVKQHLMSAQPIPLDHSRELFGARLQYWVQQHAAEGTVISDEHLNQAFEAFGPTNGDRLKKLMGLEKLKEKQAYKLLASIGLPPREGEFAQQPQAGDPVIRFAQLAGEAYEAINAREHRIAALDPTADAGFTAKVTPQTAIEPKSLSPEAVTTRWGQTAGVGV